MGEQDDFVRTLEKATLKIIEEMARNMELACLVIERDAKENCPVSEQGGHLRASITHDVTYNASQKPVGCDSIRSSDIQLIAGIVCRRCSTFSMPPDIRIVRTGGVRS